MKIRRKGQIIDDIGTRQPGMIRWREFWINRIRVLQHAFLIL